MANSGFVPPTLQNPTVNVSQSSNARQKYHPPLGEMKRMSAERTHEMFELLSMKKILDSYRGGPYFASLNEYIDRRMLELLATK
jgi:hypothetical protein